MINPQKAVILFIRYPEEGKVKTRIASTVGNKFALRLYELCLEHLLNECKKLKTYGVDLFVFFDNEEKEKSLRHMIGKDFNLVAQKGKSLGEKISNSFSEIFGHGYSEVIIVGSDIPDLSTEIMLESFNKLETYEVVIGPSFDGGYYLLGMNKYFPFLFEDIKWSSDSVFSDTLLKISQRKILYDVLKTLKDLDTENDIVEWLNEDEHKNVLKTEIRKLYQAYKT